MTKFKLILGALGCSMAAAMFVPGHAQPQAQSQDAEWHWYRGNTHTHTNNSDGDSSPDTVARWYRENGYHFVFITDHGYVTDVAPLNSLLGAPERFVVLSGEEITQSRRRHDPQPGQARFDEPHVNALFTTQIIPPVGFLDNSWRFCYNAGCAGRADSSMPLGDTLHANITRIQAAGGIGQINHPNYVWSMRPDDLDHVPDRSLLEIWNGQGVVNNLGGDDGKGDVRPSAEGFWDHALSKGRIVWGVGADDSHFFQGPEATDPHGAAPGQAWIMVRATSLTPDNIKSSIASGNFYASTGVVLADVVADDSGVSVSIRGQEFGPRFITRFIGQDGVVLAEQAGLNPRYSFTGKESYVRAAITDSNGLRAWTQPVFRDRRDRR